MPQYVENELWMDCYVENVQTDIFWVRACRFSYNGIEIDRQWEYKILQEMQSLARSN